MLQWVRYLNGASGRRLAHEAGHGLLHAYLFVLGETPLNLFDRDSQVDHKILCRDVQGEERNSRAYDGRWWEFQANRAMGVYYALDTWSKCRFRRTWGRADR
jgi:hypothetical protein